MYLNKYEYDIFDYLSFTIQQNNVYNNWWRHGNHNHVPQIFYNLETRLVVQSPGKSTKGRGENVPDCQTEKVATLR